MGLFSRKQPTASGTGRAPERALDSLEPLQAGQATFRARELGVGRRGKKLIPAVEVVTRDATGHFRADELGSFLGGRLGIIETLYGSPSTLFIATGAHAGTGSPAGDALAHAAKDEAGLLMPAGEEVRRLALFSTADQQRIASWLALFPRP